MSMYNKPMRFIDPDGMSTDDFIVYSMEGEELRIKSEGDDILVKVNKKAFDKKSSKFSTDNKDYNTILSIVALRNEEAKTGVTNLIAEQTGISLDITGSMREGSNLIGDVSVDIQQHLMMGLL